MDICSDLNNSDLNAEDNNDDKISTTSSEAALFDSISFDGNFYYILTANMENYYFEF